MWLSPATWCRYLPVTREVAASWMSRFRRACDALEAEDIDPRDLVRQLLLHLPRYPDRELADSATFGYECTRWRDRLTAHRSRAGVPRIPDRTSLHECRLEVILPSFAGKLHKTLHYLGSPRFEGIHLGLLQGADTWPWALASFAPLDVPFLVERLPFGFRKEDALVLSRFLTLPGAPYNTASRTLGQAKNWIRRNYPHIKLVFTYVNPNLGFTGTVFRSANWRILAHQPKRPYIYLDGDYVTDRAMIRRFGSNDPAHLRTKVGRRLSTSQHPLRPLEVYALEPARARRQRPILIRVGQDVCE